MPLFCFTFITCADKIPMMIFCWICTRIPIPISFFGHKFILYVDEHFGYLCQLQLLNLLMKVNLLGVKPMLD